MSDSPAKSHETPDEMPQGVGLFARWHTTPLYLRIIGALVLGLLLGLMLHSQIVDDASRERIARISENLAMPSKLVLRLLSALAPALILVAIVHALMTAQLQGRTTAKMIGLLIMNTLMAIVIGLFVANIIQPGRSTSFVEEKKPAKTESLQWQGERMTVETPKVSIESGKDGTSTITAEAPKITVENPSGGAGEASKEAPAKTPNILGDFLDNVPKSLLGPLTDNGRVLGVIFIAVAFGIAFRKEKDAPIQTLQDVVELILRAFITVLHWIIDIIPFAIFGIVASIVGDKGFEAFHSLGKFVLAVILALILQAIYYLTRVHFGSWVKPRDLLRGGRDALVMAFSTASSTATMPVTYQALKSKVGLREQSASMGSLVGANFNNDGTALYEAMSALFIAQLIGQDLSLTQQFLVVITSVIASVGAAGIPEAGLVTMTLVFTAVGLPIDKIPLLLTVDWFLDRCRTAINVMGDMNVSCLLDGKTPASAEELAREAVAAE
jgi:Na+/H+-dicarboxylate symporter